MIAEGAVALLTAQRNRPLSVAVAAFSLFIPTSLTIFLSKPELYARAGLEGVILLSVGMSLPITLLCFEIWYTPLSSMVRIQRLLAGRKDETDIEKALSTPDAMEWPALLTGGWTSNTVLYILVALAYRHPLRLGATYLLTAGVLFGVWLLVAAASIRGQIRAARRAQQQSLAGSFPVRP